MDDLTPLRQQWLDRISAASDPQAIEDVRLSALGKKGELSLMMRELGRMSPEERQTTGKALNQIRDEIDAALRARKLALEDAALDARLRDEWLDVTLPGRPRRQGSIHPISQVTDEVTAIFADMGFAVAEGPQVESDWYNFDALNIAPEHPARQEHDTFFMHREPGDDRRRMCCAPIPAPCRSARCRSRARRSASSRRAASIAWTWTRPIRRCSTRSRVWPSAATSAWPS